MPYFHPARRAAALAVVILLLCAGCAEERNDNPYLAQPNPSARPISAQTDAEYTISDVAEALSPTVVGLKTRMPGDDGEIIEGIGSGVIVTEDGFLITNYHVAGRAWQVTAIFSDGTQAAGNTVWRNKPLDLAVVKLEGRFPYASLGSSQDVRLGEQVVAIGTPLTLQFQHTVTSGIVSARGRTLQIPTDDGRSFMEDLIQTDASINPGNSGGPLINLRGEVIGINSVKITQAEGIGFAIPADIIRPVIEHLARDGSYATPYLGLFAIDSEIARFYEEDMGEMEGLLVINIDPQGPGAQAGFQVGDILTHADDTPLATMLDLRRATFAHKAGEAMRLTFMRNGSIKEAEVMLAESPV